MQKIIVVKIGSSILITKRGKLDEFRIEHIARQVLQLQAEGFGVVLVVSGAVASGFKFVSQIENQNILRQAAAGIGQTILISTFQGVFASKKIQIAQILLTQESLKREDFKDLLEFYLSLNIVPIINENDVISLNCFGGNDLLASEIAFLVEAEKLLILSTYDKSFFGVGGGETKKQALEFMKTRNIKASILDGKKKDTILEAML